MVGRSLLVRTVAQPEMRSEFNQTKNPRLKGPLVLSFEIGFSLDINILRFSIVSSTSKVNLNIVEVERVAAYAMFSDMSHSVRSRAASNRSETNKYAVRMNDGRTDLTCST